MRRLMNSLSSLSLGGEISSLSFGGEVDRDSGA